MNDTQASSHARASGDLLEHDHSAAPSKTPFSAYVYVGIALLVVLQALSPFPALRLAGAVLIVSYLLLEGRAAPRGQRIVASLLAAAGVALALVSGNAGPVLLDGVSRSQIFLVLFFAVAWLQVPSTRSPALKAARASAISQPPGRRHLVLSLTVHALGGVLNLAGLTLLVSIVGPRGERALRRRFTMALMQGFTSVSSWSPFFISMPVVLVAIPSLRWSDLAPWGVMMSAVIVLVGWGFDRLFLRRPGEAASAPPVPLAPVMRWRLLGILLPLVGLTMAMVEGAGLVIPVALALVIPPYALVWFASMRDVLETEERVPEGIVTRVFRGFPGLRGEVMMFVAASVFGVGVASVTSPRAVGEVLAGLAMSPDAALAAMVAIITACAVIGLHPVVLIILIGEVLPPEVLGLRHWVMGLALVSAWGMSVIASPFSGVTLFMSRNTGLSNFHVAWRWNLPAVAVTASFEIATLLAIRHLTLAG